MKKHLIRMIIGCTLPLLSIFFAPALVEHASLFIFIIAMFACHLLIPMHHKAEHKHETSNENLSKTSKTVKNEPY